MPQLRWCAGEPPLCGDDSSRDAILWSGSRNLVHAACGVGGGGYRSPDRYQVEPDASAASYFWAAAAVTGDQSAWLASRMTPSRAMWPSLPCLRRWEASASRGTADEIIVTVGRCEALMWTSAICPTPLRLWLWWQRWHLAPRRSMESGFIRGKESDRIAAAVAELRRCGVNAMEPARRFRCGAKPRRRARRCSDPHLRRPSHGHGLLGAGLVVPGVKIENPGCVAKTFPGFFDKLKELRPGPCGRKANTQI